MRNINSHPLFSLVVRCLGMVFAIISIGVLCFVLSKHVCIVSLDGEITGYTYILGK